MNVAQGVLMKVRRAPFNYKYSARQLVTLSKNKIYNILYINTITKIYTCKNAGRIKTIRPGRICAEYILLTVHRDEIMDNLSLYLIDRNCHKARFKDLRIPSRRNPKD
jgi:hypothetical protein